MKRRHRFPNLEVQRIKVSSGSSASRIAQAKFSASRCLHLGQHRQSSQEAWLVGSCTIVVVIMGRSRHLLALRTIPLSIYSWWAYRGSMHFSTVAQYVAFACEIVFLLLRKIAFITILHNFSDENFISNESLMNFL